MNQEPMDFESLFNDRRNVTDPARQEPEFAQDQVHTTADEPCMTPDILVDSLRFPSAHPGPGVMVMPRQQDRNLCMHCFRPLIAHGCAHGVTDHMPERLERTTPGVHPQADRGAMQQRFDTEARQLPRGAATR